MEMTGSFHCCIKITSLKSEAQENYVVSRRSYILIKNQISHNLPEAVNHRGVNEKIS